MKLIDKQPTPLEAIIFKWIFLPALVIGLLLLFIGAEQGKRACTKKCIADGYSNATYIPAYRGTPEKCECLSEEVRNKENRK